MILTFLALYIVSTAHKEPPEILGAFTSTEACLIEADRANRQHYEQLVKAGAAFVCLTVKEPTT